MRIQTRLFLGTAALVLALTGLQWWLYARQLRAIEGDLTNVAAAVGKGILTAEFEFFGGANARVSNDGVWVIGDAGQVASAEPQTASSDRERNVHVVMIPQPPPVAAESVDGAPTVRRTVEHKDEGLVEEIVWVTRDDASGDSAGKSGETPPADSGEAAEGGPLVTRKLMLTVEDGEKRHDRFLVVSEDDRNEHRIPIPVSPTVTRIQETMRRSAAVGGLLLAVGLLASAVMSSRLTRPLRSLAEGADRLAGGDLGVQVQESAFGEVGDLERAFNRMSYRLRELEGERQVWQQREHLAQLGDLSRGLAHTLRNPLHTLGLAVEELADAATSRQDLVETSRAQIRRIDRWLRSFLALGVEESVDPEAVDLGGLVKDIALEAVQQGADVQVEDPGGLTVRGVPGALRAAIGNLVENAVQASPPGAPVEVSLRHDGDEMEVRIVDHGRGLPKEVSDRLYSPHVTTKAGGAGMGLFLARQLIVGMHGGRLDLEDGDGGGTIVTVRLTAAGEDAGGSELA